MTERQRMLAGESYLASDPELTSARLRCRLRLHAINQAAPTVDLTPLFTDLFGRVGENAIITPPFFCDYGSHVSVGARFYANFNCVILDCNRVEIGDDVLL